MHLPDTCNDVVKPMTMIEQINLILTLDAYGFVIAPCDLPLT